MDKTFLTRTTRSPNATLNVEGHAIPWRRITYVGAKIHLCSNSASAMTNSRNGQAHSATPLWTCQKESSASERQRLFGVRRGPEEDTTTLGCVHSARGVCRFAWLLLLNHGRQDPRALPRFLQRVLIAHGGCASLGLTARVKLQKCCGVLRPNIHACH